MITNTGAVYNITKRETDAMGARRGVVTDCVSENYHGTTPAVNVRVHGPGDGIFDLGDYERP